MTAALEDAGAAPSAEDLLCELIAAIARACADAERRRRRLRVHYAQDGQARCGQRDAVRVTAAPSRVTCRLCLARLAGPHDPGHWLDLRPCGTTAAYRRHKRRGEAACFSCLQANARDKADRKAARMAALLQSADGGEDAGLVLETAA